MPQRLANYEITYATFNSNSGLSHRADSRIAGRECNHPRLKLETANFSNLQQAVFTTALIGRKDQCGAVRVVEVGISV